MLNQTTPRQNNIRSLINSIRTIANDVYREVGSNPQDPSFSIQPIQSQPNDSNIQSLRVQPPQKPALTMSQTPISNTSINLAKPSSEIGNLLQGIQKAHAKVDEVIRTVPKEVQDQVMGGQTKSLNDVIRDPTSSLQNLQIRETVSHSLQDIASYRFTSSNPFAKNAANGAYTITASTPYLNPPMAGENLKTSVYESQAIQAQAPLRTSYVPLNGYALPQGRGPFTKNENNLYQSVSLNDIPNSSEPTDENRPKSLLHASNYFKSTKKSNAYQTPLQEKYKQFFPQQSTSSRQFDQPENPQKVQDFFAQNNQISTVKKAPENPNQHVEKILDKLRYQEERHKRQRMEEDYEYFEENQYFEEETPTIGKNEAGRRRAQTQRRASRDSRKLIASTTDLQEEAPSIVLSNDISEEQSVRANSRQDIERRIEQLGKESRKSGPKKVIPSLGGGQLVIEKKQSSDLDRNTQVFGKETSSGGNMARQGLQKKRNLTRRDRNPNEFMVKNPASLGQRRQREREREDEFDFEEEDFGNGEAEQQFYGQRSEKENRSRSRSRRVDNGEMVWSSHKKSKRMLENIVF